MQTYTQLATLSPGILGMFDGQHYLLFCLKEPITDELVAEWTADEKTIISAPGQRACTSIDTIPYGTGLEAVEIPHYLAPHSVLRRVGLLRHVRIVILVALELNF